VTRGCAKRVSADEKADGDQMQRSEQNVQVARMRDRAPLLRRKDSELFAATHLRPTVLIPAPGSAHRAYSGIRAGVPNCTPVEWLFP
jgi:hypothetical protein